MVDLEMIASIIDIVASRDVTVRQRRKMDREIRDLIDETYRRFKKYCLAIPALTQGDSIELLVNSWHPVVFLLHRLLMQSLEVRIGLGIGEIIVQNENADDCDGPAFWNAREALDEIKSRRYMNKSAGIKSAEEILDDEKITAVNIILLFTALLGLSSTQLLYCFYYIWENKRISEIAEVVKTTKGNVSRTLSRTPCYLLEEVMTYLGSF